MKHKLKNFNDYIAMIKWKPGMYLGQNHLSKLHTHLQGYFGAHFVYNPLDESAEDFANNFNDFIDAYYKIKQRPSFGWYDTLLAKAKNNEVKALELFFKMYELFCLRSSGT